MGASTSTSRGIGTYFLHVLAWVSDFHSKCSILLQYSETQASGTNRRLLAFPNFQLKCSILLQNSETQANKQGLVPLAGTNCCFLACFSDFPIKMFDFITKFRNASKQGVQGARCQVSGVRCQVSGVRCQAPGARCQVSGVRC